MSEARILWAGMYVTCSKSGIKYSFEVQLGHLSQTELKVWKHSFELSENKTGEGFKTCLYL